MLFAMVLHMLWPQFSPPLDFSPQTLQLTRNPTFTSHLTLTLVPLTSPLPHTTQPHHHSLPTAVPLTPSAPISPSAPYLPSFLSVLTLRMLYKLSVPMPTHIHRNMNARNLTAQTKPTHPLLLSLAATHLSATYFIEACY